MKPTLDYVSPLPPVRSGISDYSVDLLPALAEVCDVRVLQLPDQPVSPEVAERWNPVPAEEALREEAEGAKGKRRLPLYQMGNNRYHRDVERLAMAYPGVLTLHDLVLHHLLMEETLGVGVHVPYRDRLAADHGWLGQVIAQPRRWGGYSNASLFSLPAHRTLLQRQRGVLVHNRWAAERIAEEDPRIPVRVVPMGVPLAADAADSEAAARELRRRFGLPLEAPVLGSFGFQTPIKRTGTVVEALARPGLEAVHLLIVGQVSEHANLEGIANDAGVAERVHITGFLPYEDFEAAIAATDLCLNLRYPTAGETSASLLRILAAGRPAIVSDFAQFAELPDEVALKVPLGDDEVEVLAARLRELLAEREALQRMGRAARRHVAEVHAPERAAAAIAEACTELSDLEPPGYKAPRDLPPTSLTWTAPRGELTVTGAEEPWPPGERRRLQLELRNTGPDRWLPGRSGPGGVALEVQVVEEVAGEEPLIDPRPWIPLPRPVSPGESWQLEVEIRRPVGEGRLRLEPHILGGPSFGAVAGPVWQQRLGT
jgi:glycosyltransferase involved in cell wall biosynthesis